MERTGKKLWSDERIKEWILDQMRQKNDGAGYLPGTGSNVPPTWIDVDRAMRVIRDDYERTIDIYSKANRTVIDKLNQIRELVE